MTDAWNQRDLDSYLAVVTADGRYEDRRKGLRDAGPIKPDFARSLFVEAAPSWQEETVPVAIRGSRLVLRRLMFRDHSEVGRPIAVEALVLIEVTDDELVGANVVFNLDDVDSAFAELDARYLAREAAAHAHTWSVIANGYAALNRRELFATTPDWVNVDHRHGTGFEPGGFFEFIRAASEVAPDMRRTIEAVHRLNTLGAVFTHTAYGTSREGFDAEWRTSVLLTVDGDLINRLELFDDADIDAALARLDELNRSAPQLENAATRAWARIADAYNRRDLDGFLAQTTIEGRLEDRRKLLRAEHEGPERRKAAEAWLRAPESWRMEIEPIAIRGDRLGLTRERSRDTAEADQPIVVETLTLTETDDSELVCYTVLFGPDDINGAMAELTARWIASGEVAHPGVIEAVHRLNETVNRHDWDAIATLSADASYVNHRQLSVRDVETVADHMPSIQAMASLVPDYWVEFADVLTHTTTGLVSYTVLRGTSTEGFVIEIPLFILFLLDGDRVISVEAFDENQRDLALARFDELDPPT
jgi:hypothetical protein